MFPIIGIKRMITLLVLFPLATFSILNLYTFSAFYKISISLLHSITMIIIMQIVNLLGLLNSSMIEKPIILKLATCIIYPILSLGYVLFSLILNNDDFTTLSMYLLGLVTMFAALNGLFINCEVNSDSIGVKNLELLHIERLNIIWPCIFFFVVTFLSTPFIAVLAAEKIESKSLYAGICVGAIGFTTLIIIPLDNLRSVREKLDDM